MFGIAWSELLLIGIVALVVVPPKDLPALMRTVGKWVGQMRRMAFDFQHQVSSALREAELDDLKKSVSDLTSTGAMADLKAELESATRPLTMLEGQMREDLTIAAPTFTSSGEVAPLEETPGLVDGAYRGTAEAEPSSDTTVPSPAAETPLDLAPVPVDVTTLPGEGPQVSEPVADHEHAHVAALAPRVSGAAS